MKKKKLAPFYWMLESGLTSSHLVYCILEMTNKLSPECLVLMPYVLYVDIMRLLSILLLSRQGLYEDPNANSSSLFHFLGISFIFITNSGRSVHRRKTKGKTELQMRAFHLANSLSVLCLSLSCFTLYLSFSASIFILSTSLFCFSSSCLSSSYSCSCSFFVLSNSFLCCSTSCLNSTVSLSPSLFILSDTSLTIYLFP